MIKDDSDLLDFYLMKALVISHPQPENIRQIINELAVLNSDDYKLAIIDILHDGFHHKKWIVDSGAIVSL